MKQSIKNVLCLLGISLMTALVVSPIKAEAYVLKDNMTVSESKISTWDGIDLNGKTLTVEGNLNYGKPIAINGGKLVVTGNMTVSGSVSTSNKVKTTEGSIIEVGGNYTQIGNGLLLYDKSNITVKNSMYISQNGYIGEHSNDVVVNVAGDFGYDSSQSTKGDANPTFNVGGDIDQSKAAVAMRLGDVVLTGNGGHRVNIQQKSSFKSFKPGTGVNTFGKYLNIGSLNGDLKPVFKDSALIVGSALKLNGHTLTIDGDLVVNAPVYANASSKLVVDGDLNATSSISTAGGGTINVNWNYTQENGCLYLYDNAKINVTGNMEFSNTGYIEETNSNAVVNVKRNLIYSSTKGTEGTATPSYIVGGNLIQKDNSGSMDIGVVTMSKVGSTVTVTNGRINTLILYHSKDEYNITSNCYKNLKVACDIIFDANGGVMSAANISVKTGDSIGTLPVPTKDGYKFAGWFTQKEGGTLINSDTKSAFISDTTLWAHWNAGDETQVSAFVNRLYQILLGRDAEEDGLAEWTDKLVSGKANASQIVEGIVNSQEFANMKLSNSDIVERMYKAMLGRASDKSGKSNWVDKLDKGLSVNAIINGFSGSVEFAQLCDKYKITAGSISLGEPRDKNPGITEFVSRCYVKALGRSFDVGGLNYWCETILDSSDMKAEAERTASNGFFHSEEFGNKKTTNEQYVEILYRTFLDREYDLAGKNYWVAKLNSGVSRDEVLYGFSRSQEFSNLMDKYIN